MPHPAHLSPAPPALVAGHPGDRPAGEGTALQIGDLLGGQAGLLIGTPRTAFVRATFSSGAGATTFGMTAAHFGDEHYAIQAKSGAKRTEQYYSQ